MKFTEAKLEDAIIQLLGEQGFSYVSGESLTRPASDVLIKEDLVKYLHDRYQSQGITDSEVQTIVRQLELMSHADLYESNKTFCKWLSDGFLLKREDPNKKDLYIQLIDYSGLAEMRRPSDSELDLVTGNIEESAPSYQSQNIYKIVNQLEIEGPTEEKRIPDGILYINGLPLVVFEFKSAIREEATIHDAYIQLTTRYSRAIPQLFLYNAFCVISDGANNRMGTLFSAYGFYYTWRKVTGDESIEQDGISSSGGGVGRRSR